MDSALACCAGSPGSIPAVGKSKKECTSFFSLQVVGHKNGDRHENVRDLASPLKVVMVNGKKKGQSGAVS